MEPESPLEQLAYALSDRYTAQKLRFARGFNVYHVSRYSPPEWLYTTGGLASTRVRGR